MTTIEIQKMAPTATRWTVDRDRTVVEFAVKTFWGLTTVRGRFDRFDGAYEVGPDGAKMELTADADSIDTGNATRDRHLRSADFFGVAEHPQVRFSSTRVGDARAGTVHVEGELEAGGKAAALEVGATVRRADDGLEVEATTTVDHRQLGMSSGLLGMIRRPATLHVKARLIASGPVGQSGHDPGAEAGEGEGHIGVGGGVEELLGAQMGVAPVDAGADTRRLDVQIARGLA